MAIEKKFNERGEPVIVVPGVPVDSTLGELVLTWMNAKVCLFGDQNFDHVEYHDPNRRERFAMAVSRELLDRLVELNYPHDYRPIPDEATSEWFYERQAEILEEELYELGE